MVFVPSSFDKNEKKLRTCGDRSRFTLVVYVGCSFLSLLLGSLTSVWGHFFFGSVCVCVRALAGGCVCSALVVVAACVRVRVCVCELAAI